MRYALIHESDNNRIVQVSDETFPVHQDLVWVECSDEVTSRHKYVDGSFIEPTARPQYQREREAEYPSLAEQLDMQYWDSVNGTTTWADAIAKVKADYPKGAE